MATESFPLCDPFFEVEDDQRIGQGGQSMGKKYESFNQWTGNGRRS